MEANREMVKSMQNCTVSSAAWSAAMRELEAKSAAAPHEMALNAWLVPKAQRIEAGSRCDREMPGDVSQLLWFLSPKSSEGFQL